MALGPYLFWGSVFGAFLIVCYVLIAGGTPDKKPELSQAIGLFLAANGVAAAIRLFVLVYTARSLGALNDTDRIYLAVGAIAAMWISLQTVGRAFADVEAAPPLDEEEEKEADHSSGDSQ